MPFANEVLEHCRNLGMEIDLSFTVVGFQEIVVLAPPCLLMDFR